MKISVIMNYYSRQAILERCLWSIYHFTNPIEDFEIVIVDDKSPPGTRAKPIVEKFKKKLPIRLFYRKEKQGKNCGMPLNIAAQKADGDVLITHDPDFVHMTSIINQVAGAFWERKRQFAVASCYSLPASKQSLLEETDFSQANAVLELRERIVKKTAGIRAEGDDAWNCHSRYRPYGLGSIKAILRDDFINLGGFDEDFYQFFGFEDTDFLNRVHQSGIPIRIDDSMLVYHQWHYSQKDTEDVTNRQMGYKYNREIYENKAKAQNVAANKGRKWGKL